MNRSILTKFKVLNNLRAETFMIPVHYKSSRCAPTVYPLNCSTFFLIRKFESYRRNSRDSFFTIFKCFSTFVLLTFIGIGNAFCSNTDDEKRSSLFITQNILNGIKGISFLNPNFEFVSVNSSAYQENTTEKVEIPIVTKLNQLPKNNKILLSEDKRNNMSIKCEDAVNLSISLLRQKQLESGSPGISICVSVNGEVLFSIGMGFSDLENNVLMTSKTVMRIASISKPLTCVAVCQLIEDKKLDIDEPVQKYVPEFPAKFYEGEEVTITTRHLLSHTSGIRHYKLPSKNEEMEEKVEDDSINQSDDEKVDKPNQTLESSKNRKEKKRKGSNSNSKQPYDKEVIKHKKNNESKNEQKSKNEFTAGEYYLKNEFNTIQEALDLFKDDDLLFKPGDGFEYSTHAWTLISAVIEGASGKSFKEIMKNLFHDLNMKSTYFENDSIIMKRCRFYIRDSDGRLKNAPYVNNSYKWAGGGFLSNVNDLTHFGNAMLYSYQNSENYVPKGFLKSSTLKKIWKPHSIGSVDNSDKGVGLGWFVVENDRNPRAFAHSPRFFAAHTGGAVGCSSVLLILPSKINNGIYPSGVVVSIMCNMQNVSLQKVAMEIAEIFDKVKLSKVTECKYDIKFNDYNLVAV